MRDISLQSNKHIFGFLYLAVFIFSFHLYLVAYSDSSYLNLFVDEKYIGTIYMVSAFIGMLAILSISKILRKIGNYKMLLLLSGLEFIAFIGLSILDTIYIVIPLFIIYSVTFPLLLFSFDVFLESLTKEEDTGTVRGIYLTIINSSLVIAPFVGGLIVNTYGLQAVYLVSAFFLIPFVLFARNFKKFEDPKYHIPHIASTLQCIRGRNNLYNILIVQFLMRFFFAWMIIYMPLYLNTHIGFSWAEIGTMTSLILLPYVLFEFPVGKIADKLRAEKYFLIAGFSLVGIFTFALSFVQGTNFLLWAGILMMTRIGASFIEVMSESYFFKLVDGSDNNTISFFRITGPVAYVVGPLVGSLLLFFIGIKYIWIILGIILLSGIWFSYKIVGTRKTHPNTTLI